MTTTVTTNKPFHIEKKRVYEAYKAVRSNRGAAGVDGQTLEQFDEDLGGNLYTQLPSCRDYKLAEVLAFLRYTSQNRSHVMTHL
jgi:hypothetical protein